MKTFKDLITKSSKAQSKDDSLKKESLEIETLDILELQEYLDIALFEKEDHGQPHDPPAVLIMRRKQIRQFPGGQRVALYYVDNLNKYVTVPYEGMGWSSPTSEETIIHHLKNIVENHSVKSYKFKDGKTMEIDEQTAKVVLSIHEAVDDENKKKIEEMASKSKQHFTKVVDFAWKHTQLK